MSDNDDAGTPGSPLTRAAERRLRARSGGANTATPRTLIREITDGMDAGSVNSTALDDTALSTATTRGNAADVTFDSKGAMRTSTAEAARAPATRRSARLAGTTPSQSTKLSVPGNSSDPAETPRGMIRELTKGLADVSDLSVASSNASLIHRGKPPPSQGDVSIRAATERLRDERLRAATSAKTGAPSPRTLIRQVVANTSTFEDSTVLDDSRARSATSNLSTTLSTTVSSVGSVLSHPDSTASTIAPSTANTTLDSSKADSSATTNASQASSLLDNVSMQSATSGGNLSMSSLAASSTRADNSRETGSGSSDDDGDDDDDAEDEVLDAEQRAFVDLHDAGVNVTAVIGEVRRRREAGKKPRAVYKRRQARPLSSLFPNATIKHFVQGASTRLKFSPGALETIGESLDSFVDAFSESLQRTAHQAGRVTIEVKDVEVQMLRQGLISSTHELRQLLHGNLPMEFVEQLLPAAMASNAMHPACKKAKLTL